jgi:hypothetical protein
MADSAIVELPDELRADRKTRCRECGAKLTLYRRLTNAAFCCESHARSYEEKRERALVERLLSIDV